MLFQRGLGVAHGVSDVAGGMQNIGCNHQIVASCLDPLLCQWRLHVHESIG